MQSPAVMVRLVVGEGGVLTIGRLAAGRGAWVCGEGDDVGLPSRSCLTASMRKGAMRRALRAELAADAAEGLLSGSVDKEA